ILGRIADDAAQAKRLLAWVESPARKLADRIAEAQEALLFQRGGADWAWPDDTISGLTVTRSLIAETLPLFWPRPDESWGATVMEIRALARDASIESFKAAETALGIWIPR